MTTMFDFGYGPVPAHQHKNGGGWVADTAMVAETAFVGPNARVYGNAWVYGNAQVYGNALVYGNAQVYGNAIVSKTTVVLTGFPHTVTITDHHCAVGCQMHPPSVWKERGAAIIRADGHTIEQAKAWAAIIVSLIDAHGCVDKECEK